MEPSPDSTNNLVARANLARARLSATLGVLERRRREMVNLPVLVLKHRGALVIVLACAGGLVAYGVYHAAMDARRRRLGRWARMQRAWSRPESVEKKPSALSVLARALATQLARALVARLLTFAMGGRQVEETAPALPGGQSPEPSPSAL